MKLPRNPSGSSAFAPPGGSFRLDRGRPVFRSSPRWISVHLSRRIAAFVGVQFDLPAGCSGTYSLRARAHETIRMPLFLDACALAKRYLPEHASSRRMKEITGRFDRWGGFVVSAFIEPEVLSAFAKYAREHPVYPYEYLRRHPQVVDRFRKELSNPAFTIVRVDDDVIAEASNLLRRHPEYAIHAGDAVHLVTAISLRADMGADDDELVFVTADRGLEEAARAEGFVTLNPMRQGISELREMVGMG